MPRIWQHYWCPIVLAALLPVVASNIIDILTTVVVAPIVVAMVIVVPSITSRGYIVLRIPTVTLTSATSWWVASVGRFQKVDSYNSTYAALL